MKKPSGRTIMKAGVLSAGRVRAGVVTAVMSAFISYRRAAAIVLDDLASSKIFPGVPAEYDADSSFSISSFSGGPSGPTKRSGPPSGY